MYALCFFWHVLRARGRNTIAVIDDQQSLESLCRQRIELWEKTEIYKDNPSSPDFIADCLWRMLLSQTSGYNASLPHDMIYGLLGMLTAIFGETAIPPHLAPNYKLPFEKVYWDYSRFIIENTGNLSILCNNGSPLRDTPTWVPDLRKSAGIQGENAIGSRRPPYVLAPHISSDGRILTLEAIKLGTYTAVCSAVPDYVIPDIHSSLKFETHLMNRRAHDSWLKQRGQLIEDRICKPAAAVTTRGRTLSQARLDVLRPDGLLQANQEVKTLLLNLYETHCLSLFRDALLEKRLTTSEIHEADLTYVWRWLELQLSKQLFVTNSGDIGSALNGSQAQVKVDDEVFLFDDIPFAFVLRREKKSSMDCCYNLIACARLRAGEAHAAGRDDSISGLERVRINIT